MKVLNLKLRVSWSVFGLVVLMGAIALAVTIRAGATDVTNHGLATTASLGCRTGGKPTLPHPSISGLPGFGKLVGGPVVVGCGHSNREFVQLVAFSTTREVCVGVDRVKRKRSEGGECKLNSESWQQKCSELCIYSVIPADVGPHRQMNHVIISGQFPITADRIRVDVVKDGTHIDAPAIEARVEGDLMNWLHQTEEFGVFAAVLSCVAPRSVHVIAEEDGHVIAKARGHKLFADPCRSPSPLAAPPTESGRDRPGRGTAATIVVVPVDKSTYGARRRLSWKLRHGVEECRRAGGECHLEPPRVAR